MKTYIHYEIWVTNGFGKKERRGYFENEYDAKQKAKSLKSYYPGSVKLYKISKEEIDYMED